MWEYRVKEIILYFQSQAGRQWLSTRSREQAGEPDFTVCGTELSFLEALFLKRETDGVVVFTDYVRAATAYSAKGGAAVGLLCEENRDASFEGVTFLVESPDAFDRSYAELVYARKKDLPCFILETGRCILRETTEEDVAAFYGIYEEPSITRYMENLFADPQEERAYIEAYRKSMYGFYGFGIWTVILKETAEIIGRAGLDLRQESGLPELGFVIGVPWQGRGIAFEVCDGILRYAKEELDLSVIQAVTEQGNQASESLLRKLGFSGHDGLWEKKI